ncbi:CHAP domain-containing protein [Pseudonocardia sp. NPDC049635]|uniref:CHAP domain-containing protein n=1 Tax=Pseudonocardia sp. NPDC049635 TaxID=3155506 RepID=UPI0033F62BBF
MESPPGSNRTPYGMAYGMDGYAWCAMFTWWCFRQAGLATLVPKSAYTPTIADWFRRRDAWHTTPAVGDLVFFDFPGDGVNRISHVGLVEKINADGTITTIEGNTSPGTGGSQRNGGGVYRRVRRAGIVGYGRPAYPSGAPAQAAPDRVGRPTVRLGSRGRDVAFVQRWLGIPDDGIFGPQTEAAVRRYQAMRGLVVDGIVGPKTWREMGQ